MTGDGRRIKAVLNYFGPPRKLESATLGNYKPKTKEQQAALETCKAYASDLDNLRFGKGLLLFGKWGAGKTHLSVATTRELIERHADEFGVRKQTGGEGGAGAEFYDPEQRDYTGLYCSFFSVVDLLDLLRPGGEAKQRRAEWAWTRAKGDHLVVLDDIGAEKPSEWVEDRLYALIDTRERMERATIFTSNCTEKQLMSQLGGRIVSRIMGMTEQVLVEGPDHRRKLA